MNAFVANIFSTFSGLIYSPWDNLNKFFTLSVILTIPSEDIVAISPVRNHPFSNDSLLTSSLFRYFVNIAPPLRHISPLYTLLPST